MSKAFHCKMMKCIRGIFSQSHIDPKKKLGKRHVQALLIFLGVILTFSLRVNISVAIISMTDVNSSNSDFKTFNWSIMKTSLILSSYTWGNILSAIPNAYAIKYFGTPAVFSFSLLSGGLVHAITPLLAIKVGWIGVLCARIIVGFFGSCAFPCVQTFIFKWVPPREKERLGTFVLIGMDAGCMVGMGFPGLLASSKIGWPSVFYVYGIVTMAWGIILYWLGVDSPSAHLTISQEEKNYITGSIATADATTASNLRVPWKQIMISLPMWALIIASCNQTWVQTVYASEIPAYLNSIFDFNIGKSSVMSALPYLVAWIFSFPTSWFFDFIYRKGVPKGVIRKIANSISFWGISAVYFTFAYVEFTNNTIIVVLLILGYVLKIGSVSGYLINHVDISPNFVGMTSAITNIFGEILGMFVPIVCGIIVKDTKNLSQWRTYFLITACISLLANCIYLVCSRTDVQDWNEPTISNTENSLNLGLDNRETNNSLR